MSKSISNVYYNTHIDTEVAHWGDGRAKSDPRHVLSTLYRTKEGAWYLDTRCSDKEDLTPMSDARVQALLKEKRLDYLLGALVREKGA